jgi:hypothetical protein
MRLQLDPALTGAGISKPADGAQAVHSAGSAVDSRRAGSDPAGADSIGISGPSSALNNFSADRAARIQQLTAQVQAGSYNVPGSQISQAIVGHAIS